MMRLPIARSIPQRFEAADVAAAIAENDERTTTLEAEVARLKQLAPLEGDFR